VTSYETYIQGKYFPSKAALRRELQRLLYLYDDTTLYSPEDMTFLLGVFEMHPRWEEKCGGGIVEVFADDPPERPGRCFWLRRPNGVVLDISFTHCLNPKGYARKSAMFAMREAVRPQVIAYREATLVYPFTCPILGISVEGMDIHVDHVPPTTFLKLAEAWVRSKGYTAVADIPVTRPSPTSGPRMVEHQAEWEAYHAERATFRLISKKANLMQESGEARKRARES
jgi:hypothetical protein